MKSITAVILITICLITPCFATEINDIAKNYIDFSKNQPVFFQDLSDAIWAEDAINRLSSYNIIQGSNGLFLPNNRITRAEYVKLVIASFGLYDKAAKIKYYDCSEDDWYMPYIAVAVNLGIAEPLDKNVFGAEEFITRDDMFMFSYRAMQVAEVELRHKRDPIEFADSDLIKEDHKEAIDAMSSSGIIEGTPEGYLYPDDYSTRAEAATILDKMIIVSLGDEDIEI